jgi:hypothetical protein
MVAVQGGQHTCSSQCWVRIRGEGQWGQGDRGHGVTTGATVATTMTDTATTTVVMTAAMTAIAIVIVTAAVGVEGLSVTQFKFHK